MSRLRQVTRQVLIYLNINLLAESLKINISFKYPQYLTIDCRSLSEKQF